MKKPLFPVAYEWIKPIKLDFPILFATPFTQDISELEGLVCDGVTLVGAFGLLLVIHCHYENQYYLVPKIVIQWILWSSANKLEDQFSEMEIEFVSGSKSISELKTSLRNEYETLLVAFLKSNRALQLAAINPGKPDETIETFILSSEPDCPPALFIQE